MAANVYTIHSLAGVYFLYYIDEYQVNVLKKLRAINVDYLQVGWYQSTYLGSHVSREFLESHFRYQQAIEESVVIIYGKIISIFVTLSIQYHKLGQLIQS